MTHSDTNTHSKKNAKRHMQTTENWAHIRKLYAHLEEAVDIATVSSADEDNYLNIVVANGLHRPYRAH